MSDYRSWGFTPPVTQRAEVPAWREAALAGPHAATGTRLAYGRGRSYGDSCLNSGGVLIDTRGLDRFIAFDRENGLLTAEPGVTLAQILSVIVPQGWFLPVSPGTSFATLGGAIANDVHGKNHHVDGTFGRFIKRFVLHRSTGEVFECTPEVHPELFAATIGGLGLTGMITEATIALLPIKGAGMDVSIETFHGLEAFSALTAKYRDTHRYTVAWLDCASGGRNFARGVYLAANHEEQGSLDVPPVKSKLTFPFALPSWTLNRHSVRAFNQVYFQRHQMLNGQIRPQHYQGFFYPLDAIDRWNRIYGSKGFHQYQFVVPPGAEAVMEAVLRRIVQSGMGSFLAVLKEFGDVPSPGLMSFPRPGLCLALDFANRGARTESLIHELDAMVMEANGAAYPAKDRLMSAAAFQQYFPALNAFSEQVDPGFASDFWRRVSE